MMLQMTSFRSKLSVKTLLNVFSLTTLVYHSQLPGHHSVIDEVILETQQVKRKGMSLRFGLCSDGLSVQCSPLIHEISG